ncbi:MAG TPA: type II secretion system protein GspG [Candidatus Polarisedimenticolaceae bacterium]
MPKRPLALAVAFLLAVGHAPAAGLEPEQKLQLAKLDLGLIALLVAGFEGVIPEDPSGTGSEKRGPEIDGLQSVPDLLKYLGPVRAVRVPLRDPWGHTYGCAVTEQHLVLVSDGPDGTPDLDWGTDDAAVDAVVQRLTSGSTLVRDDIVWIDGKTFGADPERASKEAMASLRSIAVAVESYAVDADVYPSSEGRLVPIDAVTGMLEPAYIKSAPRTDPWGFPILFVSDGSHYLLVSHGADGLLEQTYTIEGFVLGDGKNRGRGAVGRPGDDLVFCDGSFAQWYEPVDAADEP